MDIIIVGGGKKVHFLIKSFVSKGYNVTIVNNNEGYCRKLSRIHEKANVVYGDGTKPYVLEDAGVSYCELVIALTDKDPDNLVICQIAEKIFKVKKTFAIVNDPKNIEVFKKLGIGTVISTANIISSLIEQKLSVEDITNLIPIEEGKVSIMEVEITDTSPILNKKLMDISIPQNALIGCIIRHDSAVIPRGDTEIMEHDKLVILSLPNVQSEVLNIIRGGIN